MLPPLKFLRSGTLLTHSAVRRMALATLLVMLLLSMTGWAIS